MKTFSCIAGTLALLASGCMSSQHSPPHASWPKPIAANNLKQFEGVFQNHSFDSRTGKATNHGNELYVFVLGPAHAHGDLEGRVEIRSTLDGNQLKLRLLDQQNQEIDSVTLQRGVDFELSDGELNLHGPFSGLRNLNSNWGPGVKLQRRRLHHSATGDLLGSTSEKTAMFVMMLIPGASTAKYWMFWPRLAK